MPQFVHLRVHSEYSIIDSLVQIKPLTQHVKDATMTAVAVTDQTNLFALIKFYRAAIQQGIKPILGADVLLRHQKEIFTITLLCKNQQGFKNLMALISLAYTEGQQIDTPCINWNWLIEYKEGLIVLSGGCDGDVAQALLQNRQSLAEQRLQQWLQHFENHFYLELQRTERAYEENYLHAAVHLALQYQVPVVATNDVRFLKKEDFEAHEARVCIHQGYTLNDPKRPKKYSQQQYLKTPQEMQELFSDIPEALENTVEIVKRCNVKLHLGKIYLPNYPIPQTQTIEKYFAEQARHGLEQRFLEISTPEEKKSEYYQRLQLEIDVINKMGFPGYFLIVADFVGWAKKNDIPVGPGRGSGAGSLVAFSLGITTLDPLEHQLLFERFLNIERVSMPDFDIDFCVEGRDRVIDYVADRYGHDAVAQIITYGTMAAKAVIRDVGRVLGMPYGQVDKVAKLVPFELGMTLQKALQQEVVLAERYQKEPEIKTLVDLAMKLEGLTRNAGKHAGGVVIAPTRLIDFVPLYCEADSEHVVTQFDKDDVEAAGLIKFDFLGLRTLTIIDWAVQRINRRRARETKQPLNIDNISLNDEKTFSLLKSCATTAVFQLESRGIKDLIRRLQPDSFDDIMALVALFRPGPLQSGMVDTFIACKHGEQTVNYPHPELEPILRTTYGVILYQEQVMKIAQVLAGYSLGQADVLRAAMGKKKAEEMAKQRAVFTKGAEEHGISLKLATHIYDLMEKFSGYGFNKSHSAAYALIAYQTAWLKAHYTAEYMSAVLSSDMDNTDKVVLFINECRQLQLKMLPPNINRGDYQFIVNAEGAIEYGLGAIKGAGQAAIENIVLVRQADGPFSSLFDFCERVDLRKVNRRVIEPLIRSGAMDCLNVTRAILMQSIDKALLTAEQKNRNSCCGQNDLFGGEEHLTCDEDHYVDAVDWNDADRLLGEKETLGLYLTGHPMQMVSTEISNITTTTIAQLRPDVKSTAIIAGMLANLRVVMTRRGKKLCILSLEDQTGVIDVTLFGELYDQIQSHIGANEILIIRGTVSDDEFSGGVKMKADTVLTLDQMREQMVKRLNITVTSQQQVDILLQHLPIIIAKENQGRCPISISYQGDHAKAELQLGPNWKIKPSHQLLQQLRTACGAVAAAFEY